MTRDLIRRGYKHRTHAFDGFTSRYGVSELVWFEVYDDIATAIAREQELKKWRRDSKIRLIQEQNPERIDLYFRSFTVRQGLWIPGPREEPVPE